MKESHFDELHVFEVELVNHRGSDYLRFQEDVIAKLFIVLEVKNLSREMHRTRKLPGLLFSQPELAAPREVLPSISC